MQATEIPAEEEELEENGRNKKGVSIGLKKTTTENSLKLMKQRCCNTQESFRKELADLTEKMQTTFAEGTDALTGGPLQAKSELENAINEAVNKIKKFIDTDVAAITRLVETARDHMTLGEASMQITSLANTMRFDLHIRAAKDLVTQRRKD